MMRDEMVEVERKETPRAACTRKVLYAIVFGVIMTVVAGVCLDNGATIDDTMGTHLLFTVLVFLPLMAGILTYSYRYYIGINWALQHDKSPTDFRALMLFAAGFLFPPAWMVNIFLYSASEFQRTKFFASLSLLAVFILAVVVALFFVP